MVEYVGDDEMVNVVHFIPYVCTSVQLLLQVAFRRLIPKVVPAIQRLLLESEVSVLLLW